MPAAGYSPCTVAEREVRFGTRSPERAVETQELLGFIDWASQAGVRRLIVDGAYTREAPARRDVAFVILLGPEYPKDQKQKQKSAADEEMIWPLLHALAAADDDELTPGPCGISAPIVSGGPRGSLR